MEERSGRTSISIKRNLWKGLIFIKQAEDKKDIKVPSKIALKNLYDVVNRLFKDNPECFYTKEQVQELKKDKTKIFI